MDAGLSASPSPSPSMGADFPASPPPPPMDWGFRASPSPSPSMDADFPAWPSHSIYTQQGRKGGHSAGVAAGVVVGVLVLFAVVAALVVLLVRRRRRQRKEQHSQSHLTEISASMESGQEKGFKQSPPTSRDFMQQPESQLHSKINSSYSVSSSASVGENAQLPPRGSLGLRTFTYQELSEATDQFSQEKFLGQGGFGSVYLGLLGGEGGEAVAIKQLQAGSFQGEREFLTEINVIGRIHHRNLVSLVGYCDSGSEKLLVYEYMENNNLAFHLQGGATAVLDWPTRMRITLGAAKGFAYLHEECQPRIIHRDIKSTNILLDSKLRAKVADFGLAKLVSDDQVHVTTRIMGSFGYLAPEFGSTGRLTEKSDVFSFGVVLLELITGRQPINLVEWAIQFLDQALEGGVYDSEFVDPKLGGNYDYKEMNQMVTSAATCIRRFPDQRPKMSQVVHVLEGNISPDKLKVQLSKPGPTPHPRT